jgi:predicted restriction endonuclease
MSSASQDVNKYGPVPTEEQWHQIWLDHPEAEPGFNQQQSSDTYTRQGLNPQLAMLNGNYQIIVGADRDSRIRGDGSGRFEALIRDWRRELIVDDLEANLAGYLTSLATGKERRLVELAIRRGQQGFRKRLLSAYQNSCAVSGCDVPEVLQAAHIDPYNGPSTDVTSNGLLLRADLHNLFDAGFISISEDYVVEVARHLRTGSYGAFHQQKLRLPRDPADYPNTAALVNRGRIVG